MSGKPKTGSQRRTLLIVSLIVVIVVLVSSIVYLSLDNGVVVNNEMELRDAVNVAVENQVIKLGNDITLTESLDISANKEITLTSKRSTEFFKLIGADGKNTITVNSNGLLRLDGIIVTHEGNGSGSGIFVEPDGTLIMIDGEITGNNGWRGSLGNAGGAGGGVYNCGVFTMFGGVISGNTATIGGGVLIVPGGVFGMEGGVVSDNKADYGGGVCIDGTFNMYGGTITNNVATYHGGGVYNGHPGTFNKFDGEIFNNTAYIGDDVHNS